MPKFPDLKYKDIVKILKASGFEFYRNAKGDHRVWRRNIDCRHTIVPDHGRKSLKRKIIKSILEDIGITVEKLTGKLKK
jgi:predicted RNA binding protein YcfA (HicA-like mRNA interferase family)